MSDIMTPMEMHEQLRMALGLNAVHPISKRPFTWSDTVDLIVSTCEESERLQEAISQATLMTDVYKIRKVLHRAMGWNDPDPQQIETTEQTVMAILSNYVGEIGHDETIVETLERIISERDNAHVAVGFLTRASESEIKCCGGACKGSDDATEESDAPYSIPNVDTNNQLRWYADTWGNAPTDDGALADLDSHVEIFVDGPGSLQTKADLLVTLSKHVARQLRTACISEVALNG